MRRRKVFQKQTEKERNISEFDNSQREKKRDKEENKQRDVAILRLNKEGD